MSRRRRRSRSSSRRWARWRSSYEGGEGERRLEREWERERDRGWSWREVLMCTSMDEERGRRRTSWMIGLWRPRDGDASTMNGGS